VGIVVAVVEVPGEGSEMKSAVVEMEDVVGADVPDASDIDNLLLATDIHK